MIRTRIGIGLAVASLGVIALSGRSEALLFPQTVSDLVTGSDRVVVGTVAEVTYAKERVRIRFRRGQWIWGEFVYTYATVQVAQNVLSADTPQPVTVRVRGGQHGRYISLTNIDPVIRRGDDVVLFLHAADRPGLGGQAVFELTNAKGGFFRVEDREGQREVTRDFTVGSLGMPGLEFRQDRGPIPLDRLLDSVRGEE